MTIRLELRLLLVCSAALTAVFLPSQIVMAKEDRAIAPRIHGWWTQTYIEGIGSAQPDVPRKGMLVENAPSGPIALSALKFSLKDGQVPKQLSLSISGSAIITQPPVACVATTAFESSQGGAWEDRPVHDCTHSVPGVVNADQTRIRFPVGKLAERRSLSVVILAGGPTDRIAFAKPGPKTLSLRIKAPSTSRSPAPTKSGTTEPVPVSEPNACCAVGVATGPPVRIPRVAPVRPRSPVALPTSAAQPDALGAGPDGIGQGETRRVLGTTLGVSLLLLCILYWSDGYGALGLRSFLAARSRKGNPDAVRPATDGVAGQLNTPAVTGTS